MIAANAAKKNHPYADWIKLYTSDIFDSSVQTAIASVEELGLTASAHMQAKMIQAFVQSTKLEWLFWHSAYEQEQWHI